MNTNDMSRERVSALADGELEEAELQTVLAALRADETKADWALYHQIGDILRSDEMAAVRLSSGFSERMAARLEAEPTVIAPASVRRGRSRLLARAAAAAAVAGLAFIITPPMIDAFQGVEVQPAPLAEVAPSGPPDVVLTAAPEGVILRDPRIDEYLLAHQRFSPSVYSSAQHARAAAFSGK